MKDKLLGVMRCNAKIWRKKTSKLYPCYYGCVKNGKAGAKKEFLVCMQEDRANKATRLRAKAYVLDVRYEGAFDRVATMRAK